jgi:hypothetical protein
MARVNRAATVVGRSDRTLPDWPSTSSSRPPPALRALAAVIRGLTISHSDGHIPPRLAEESYAV